MENIKDLVELLTLEPLAENIFLGQNYQAPWGSVFGGQVLGQSLHAAYQTVPKDRIAHSMHGYFILSKAAGLFVEAKKGPVLLNYGIDECRFTKPVYPGSTIGVKLTVKEKIDQEKRSEDDVAKGIVKYYVEVYDDTDEVVAVSTILTMVKKLDQS